MTASGRRDDRGAADGWDKPPVPIVAVPEGVVGDGGADEERAAEEAFATASGNFLDQRIEAIVEADGVDDVGLPGRGREIGGFGHIEPKGFFADHVDLAFQSLEHEFVVQGVGRADVDGVEAAIEGGGQAGIRMWDSKPVSGGFGSFEGRGDHRDDVDTVAAEGIDVDASDGSRAHNGRANGRRGCTGELLVRGGTIVNRLAAYVIRPGADRPNAAAVDASARFSIGCARRAVSVGRADNEGAAHCCNRVAGFIRPHRFPLAVVRGQRLLGVRIGIDTGGTFTDLVVMDEASGQVDVVKLPSTPDEPSRAILAALEQAGIEPASATFFVLGTTVAVNALLQRRGARVLYITTDGFEDVPFLQRVDRKFHYDLDWERPLPLVARRDCLGIRERIDYRGETVTALTADGIDNLIGTIRERLTDTDIESPDVAFALNFLFSYVRPDHEARVRQALTEAFPGIPISASHEVAPIWREYERASTTIADAAVKPLVSRFIGSLDQGLRERGFARSWSVMKSNGGQMLSHTAGERPVQTVLSGLSGGIIAGQAFGAEAGQENVITFDMGGTSTDVGVVADGRIGYTTAWEIEFGLPVAAPFIEMTTMGAGGGSIAWVNKGGLLQVGPQSAGAVPGPACYAQGGEEATVTDANVVLGRLNPDNFLGGELPLDADLAYAAIERTARKVGLQPVDTAHAVVEIAVENIAEAMRLLTVQRGLDPRVFSLVAFGGAGPLHAAAIARVIGSRATLIPPHPGLCSAFGTLLADIRVDKTWTHLVRSDAPDLDELDARLRALVREAVEDLGREGFSGEPTILRSANMRYLGQNYEEEIPIPDGPLTQDGWQRLIDGFERHYEAEYGYRIANEVIEVVQLNVSAAGGASKPQMSAIPERPPAEARARRRVYFDSREPVDCPIYEREDLSPADAIEGPAVIEELDSTTVVHPGQTLTIGPHGLASLVWA